MSNIEIFPPRALEGGDRPVRARARVLSSACFVLAVELLYLVLFGSPAAFLISLAAFGVLAERASRTGAEPPKAGAGQ